MKKEKNKISLPKAEKNEIEKKIKEGKEIKEKTESSTAADDYSIDQYRKNYL